MEYTHTIKEEQCEVMLKGKLMYDDQPSFRRILSLLEQHPLHALILNFSQVDFIDSAGLGMLLLAKDACEQRNARLVLRGAKGQVAKMFAVSEFGKIFSLENAA